MRRAIRAFILAAVLATSLASIASAQQATPAATPAAAVTGAALKTTPTGKGLPVVVRTGLHVAEVESVDEQAGAFTGAVDLRLRWEDSRLRFPPTEALGGFIDLRGERAEARLTEIWAPDVALANMIEQPAYQVRRLRIYPDGRVELMQRTTGRFKTSFDVQKFPFDRQELTIDVVERREPLHRMALDFRQDDIEFSRLADGVTIDGWQPGLLHLRRAPLPGWYGEAQSRLRASLEVTRYPARTIPSIFLPLIAAMLIPLLSLWLQRVQDGEIQIETFELSNIIIGGMFAVIALNFTISSSYPTLVDSDNTVTRLLGLNYLCLAISLVINIAVFRFNLIGRYFGKHVLVQVFRFLTWAMPVVVLATAAAIILVAMA